jgi:hypothetical protein
MPRVTTDLGENGYELADGRLLILSCFDKDESREKKWLKAEQKRLRGDKPASEVNQ